MPPASSLDLNIDLLFCFNVLLLEAKTFQNLHGEMI
jgi:hypothetical protein